MTAALLEVENLSAELLVEGRRRTVLHDVSLQIGAGEAVGLVGESGSGKSMTARAIARLLPPGATTAGAIRFDGRDVAALRGGALRDYRGAVAMVFQDPRAHVNPVRRIGDFMTEALRTLRGVPSRARRGDGRSRRSPTSGSTTASGASRSTRTSCRAACCSAS